MEVAVKEMLEFDGEMVPVVRVISRKTSFCRGQGLVTTVRVMCPACGKSHAHGEGQGPRRSHCQSYNTTTYWIKEAI